MSTDANGLALKQALVEDDERRRSRFPGIDFGPTVVGIDFGFPDQDVLIDMELRDGAWRWRQRPIDP